VALSQWVPFGQSATILADPSADDPRTLPVDDPELARNIATIRLNTVLRMRSCMALLLSGRWSEVDKGQRARRPVRIKDDPNARRWPAFASDGPTREPNSCVVPWALTLCLDDSNAGRVFMSR